MGALIKKNRRLCSPGASSMTAAPDDPEPIAVGSRGATINYVSHRGFDRLLTQAGARVVTANSVPHQTNESGRS